jgi:hypothetical protein
MNHPDESLVSRANARVGSGLMALSVAGLALCLAASSELLPAFMLRLWGQSPIFWSVLSLSAFVGGAWLLWNASHTETDWRPRNTGVRFESAVLYTKKDCPLCDEAHELLLLYRRWLPPLRVIDIEIHPDFRDAYCNCVPVLELDDVVRFRGQINEVLLRRLLQGTAPATDVEASRHEGRD